MSFSEFDIIQQYFSSITVMRPDTVLAVGDDCALLTPEPGKLLAVSSDTLVAGTHFFEDANPENIGFKSLAVNLSDLAAMGAKPAWVSLCLTLPEADTSWLAKFSRGFAQLANQFELQLIGGDLTRGPLSISVTIQGLVSPDLVLRRSGARTGDLVCVSGMLGSAALALARHAQSLEPEPLLSKALERPQPRVEMGMQLAEFATSCIDISDGLVADLGHICDASNCSATVKLDLIPCDKSVSQQVKNAGSWDLPLTGGDDYELCFTIPPGARHQLDAVSRATGIPMTIIGEIQRGKGIIFLNEEGDTVDFSANGYLHFS